MFLFLLIYTFTALGTEILMDSPENDKPDKWIMELDPDMDLIKDTSSDRFVTTFSNSPCFSNYCLKTILP